MKLERLPSGSYRAKKMYKGKLYRITFDHKPSDKELAVAIADMLQEEGVYNNGTFKSCAIQYIKIRDKVISPSTIHTYELRLKQLSDEFLAMNVRDINSNIVQAEINRFASNHAPKTVKSLYGYISTILRSYRPNLVLTVKLPQSIQKDEYIPEIEDVKRILELAKGTRYNVPFQLAALFGCRRGEICALTLDDLKGNELWIHSDMAYDGEWIKKENPKTDASNRKIVLPDSLVQEIQEQGCIYDGHPNALNKAIHRYQKRLNLPEFDFHTLRKFFCSYAHDLGVSEANIMSIGGWATSSVMKSVYRRSMEKSKRESMRLITDTLLSD